MANYNWKISNNNLKQNIMKEIIIRLTNETPSFFKKIIALGLTIGGVGAAILALPTSIIILPEIVTTIAGYMVASGVIAASLAKLTVADNSVLPKN